MGVFDRLLLVVYTLALAAVSLVVILLSLSLLSLDTIWTGFTGVYGHWEAGLAAAVILLLALKFLFSGSRTKRRRHTAIVRPGEGGSVHISVAAIKNLIEKIVRRVKGVRSVKAEVDCALTDSGELKEQGLKVELKLIVSPESNMPAVAAEVRRRVGECLTDTICIEPAEVRVRIEDIADDFAPSRRVN